jgi:hypothetical protein
MTVANRKLWRSAIASDLNTALVTSGLVQSLYAGQVADFGGQSPVVIVSSAGSDRPSDNYTTQSTALFLNLDVFVLYADSANGFDEMDAEDALDDIEAAVAEWVQANATRTPSNGVGWTLLEYAGRTGADIGPAPIGGQEYRREQIGLRVNIQGAV